MEGIVNFILFDSPNANSVIESRNNQPKAIENIIRDINIMDEPPFYMVSDGGFSRGSWVQFHIVQISVSVVLY